MVASNSRSWIAARLAVAGIVLLAAACGSTPSEVVVEGAAMGTTYAIKAFADRPLSSVEHDALAAAVAEAIDDVNRRMSTYLDDSELSRFNASAGPEPFVVSAPTLTVFLESQRLGEVSSGAFDITVGPLVNAWGFGPSRARRELSDVDISALRARTGWDKLRIEAAASSLRKLEPELYCDLSAIAKGYAVDRVAEQLVELGYQRYMVEIGGEVRAGESKPDGTPWRIAVEEPTEGANARARVLDLEGVAVATSGDYRNFYEVDGVRVSHTIDPRTGRPVAHALASVTVAHASCMTADGWATALTVLGEQEGYRLAVEQELAALFQVRRPGGEIEVRATPRFEQRFGSGGR